MRYDNQTLIDMLAAEYVLGTLRGPARKRFQSLMMGSGRIREATWQWENHLNDIQHQIPAIQPDEAVWTKICNRLGFDDPPASQPEHNRRGLSWLWPALASVATAASLVLAVFLWREQAVQFPAASPTEHLAVIKGTDTASYWLVEVHSDAISVRAGSAFQGAANRDYELWVVANHEPNPISLGLLPKQGDMTLAKDARFDQLDIKMLAVSEEPLGGSPTGLPTKVLYTADLVQF
ncbi:anti-sigma factor [Photobacterium sp. 1_MG-2023]|uniref:anti-sigma factor n=1 Tax=Photobacterium sp. 1_MG-2023 TaxID=3062646 RepID=UPI0026E282C0|nr:anti-sigma factor [Photobacterium sp. 1_MG-2023]MDO6705587.1 anti-sigma factor [Photobacterium sp. 1_MG-2023]